MWFPGFCVKGDCADVRKMFFTSTNNRMTSGGLRKKATNEIFVYDPINRTFLFLHLQISCLHRYFSFRQIYYVYEKNLVRPDGF